ncbi:MAG: hypothetical protein ACXVEF_25230 [Polyangiales bacterium]
MWRGLLACALTFGCSTRPVVIETVHVEPQPVGTGEVGLMDAAYGAADANVGALIHVDVVRSHDTTWSITRLAGWGRFAENAGLDPIMDVDRVFVAAPNVISCSPVVVLRHHGQNAAALEHLLSVSRVPGKRVKGLGFGAVAVTPNRLPLLVIAPDPQHLVMLPYAKRHRASSFADATALPGPVADEAWIGWSARYGWPPFPPQLEKFNLADGSLVARLGAKHVIELRGTAVSQASAEENAKLLQAAVDDVRDIPVIGGMIIDPIHFTATRDRVSAEIVLSPSSHQWFLGQMRDGCW